MAQESRGTSGYDKNIRSLLEAIAMLEREVGLLMDRLGVDGDTVRRALDVVGLLSADLARQAAQALGLADARAMQSLAGDVRSLLEQVARLRRRDGEGFARMDRMEEAAARLEGATNTLARLQGRTQSVLARLEERSEAFEQVLERRTRQLDSLDGLLARIDKLESAVSEAAANVSKPGRVRSLPLRSAETTSLAMEAAEAPVAKPA